MFSGSYPPEDAVFLLKPVRLAPTPVAEKERLIQSGRRHYSEMISPEAVPSAGYLRVFHEGLARTKSRFARHLIDLAGLLADRRPGPVTLVSLARAGTPVGVLLARTLRRHLGRAATHYSVSVIRDRGVDAAALRHVVRRHPAESVAFVDGWTGKGVIAGELARGVAAFNREEGAALDPGLFTLADLSGTAAAAATAEDYLIPSCVLGATVCGLVSRSILNEAVVGPGEFHACLHLTELAGADVSRWFADTVSEEVARLWEGAGYRPAPGLTPGRQAELRRASAAFLAAVRGRYGVADVLHVKPGIGEATRVLLRRVPGRLLLREPDTPDVAHLLHLAREKAVPVEAAPWLPYRAAALVREVAR